MSAAGVRPKSGGADSILHGQVENLPHRVPATPTVPGCRPRCSREVWLPHRLQEA